MAANLEYLPLIFSRVSLEPSTLERAIEEAQKTIAILKAIAL